MKLPPLPIHQTIPELRAALMSGSAVLSAPPGSGKTTVVPLALLKEPWLVDKKIYILEPRRLAARAAAFRMASLLGERVGQTVGYHIRFDRQASEHTRIEVITEGILTRRMQTNPDLPGVALVIFDEFHERSLHADLALAFCLDLCLLKDELRLLVMSATMSTTPVSKLLGGVPIITGGGQCYEVKTEYLHRNVTGRIADTTVSGITRVINDQVGDVLVFLPGVGEIREVHRKLNADPHFSDILILPLFGDLSKKDQDRAILPDAQGRRRIILATSIAETSLTIEGITSVIDSGWSRLPHFDPGSGLSRLVTVPVSKASARQRSGRAGRLGPGYCLRLYTKEAHYNLPPYHPPEILSADLTNMVLELALWGVSDPRELRWLDPPRQGNVDKARQLLLFLGAVTESGKITETGRQLATLPVHPRLGNILLRAKQSGQGALGCDLAALLSERDILSHAYRQGNGEIRVRYDLLEQWRKSGAAGVKTAGANPEVCRRIDTIANRFLRILGCKAGRREPVKIASLLISGFPDRIAQRRNNSRSQYLLASGRGVTLDGADPLTADEYVVAPKLDGGRTEGRIFLAEPVDVSELTESHKNLLSTLRSVTWDTSLEKVTATLRLTLGKIVINEQPLLDVEPEEIQQAMLTGIRRMGIECLPWDRTSRQLQARVNCVRKQYPDAGWPDLSDDYLLKNLAWLHPYLHSTSSREQLKQIDLTSILQDMLGWKKSQILEQTAPSTIRVPSGSKLGIDYLSGEIPILSVRIQEMLGQDRTPTICDGRVTLLLHLLSPAQRPIQITTDLYGFWRNSYPEIKKELKGRYPKHYWPEDPLNAEPVRGVKKKKKSI